MKYELINKPNIKYNAKQQILINRGLKDEQLIHYMSLNDDDICSPSAFGEEVMAGAAQCFLTSLENNDTICVVVD